MVLNGDHPSGLLTIRTPDGDGFGVLGLTNCNGHSDAKEDTIGWISQLAIEHALEDNMVRP